MACNVCGHPSCVGGHSYTYHCKGWFGFYDRNGCHVILDPNKIVGVSQKNNELELMADGRRWSIIGTAEAVIERIDGTIVERANRFADGQSR